MRIAFVGDVHGRILHAIAALATLQEQEGERFDLLIQVGDLGYPDPERADESTKRYLAVDPDEADLALLVQATGRAGDALHRIRTLFGQPILFVRGNHEDFSWLHGLQVDPATQTAAADRFDLLHYVRDGTILTFSDMRVAFLGGVEELAGEAHIDMDAYNSLMELGPGGFDLLVTHEGPHGSTTGYRGDVHGSQLMTELVEHVRPRYHVFGHGHSAVGPQEIGRTMWLGLDGIVASALWHPEARGLMAGCLGVLDTSTSELRHVTDDWLAEFPAPFDFQRWCEETGH
jgi:Icc-related predicted phosphoesterase